MNIEVTQLWTYPVKGARGIALCKAMVGDRGFEGDRRWMVVDANHQFVSQRTHAGLAQVICAPQGTGLALSAPGMPDLWVDARSTQVRTKAVVVWGHTCRAHTAGPQAAAWWSAYLSTPCDFVYMPDSTRRPVSQKYGGPEDIVGFADGFAFLLTTEESLEALSQKLQATVPMDRFRPNIVVRGATAFAEDHWQEVTIHNRALDVCFAVVKPCGRCVVVNVDQTTGQRHREPLRTLSGFRRQGRQVVFGQNLAHRGQGLVRVGDRVSVETVVSP